MKSSEKLQLSNEKLCQEQQNYGYYRACPFPQHSSDGGINLLFFKCATLKGEVSRHMQRAKIVIKSKKSDGEINEFLQTLNLKYFKHDVHDYLRFFLIFK